VKGGKGMEGKEFLAVLQRSCRDDGKVVHGRVMFMLTRDRASLDGRHEVGCYGR